MVSEAPKITNLKVEDLFFDPENPRLPPTMNKASDEEVLDYMIREANLIDLMLSIAEQGYFPGEPMLVVKSPSQTGKYEVVEGNRRLGALKLLKDPSLAPLKKITMLEIVSQAKQIPDEVSVILYPSRKDILLYLGYRHITGVQEWGSLAKARYLYYLKEQYPSQSYPEAIKTLAKLIGSRSDYVHKLLVSYRLYTIIEDNNYFNISNLNEENIDFSLLSTAISYRNISDYVGVTRDKSEDAVDEIIGTHLKELTEWIFKETENKTRLGDSRNLKSLSMVVAQPKALMAFREGRPLAEALLFTDEPIDILSKSIKNSLQRLSDGYRAIPQVRDSDRLKESLEKLNSTLTDIRENMRLAASIRDGVSGIISDTEIY